MPISSRENLSPREQAVFEQEREMFELQASHNIKIKELELKITMLNVKWDNLLKLPLNALLIPVRVLFGLAYIVHAIRKTEPSESFWKFLK